MRRRRRNEQVTTPFGNLAKHRNKLRMVPWLVLLCLTGQSTRLVFNNTARRFLFSSPWRDRTWMFRSKVEKKGLLWLGKVPIKIGKGSALWIGNGSRSNWEWVRINLGTGTFTGPVQRRKKTLWLNAFCLINKMLSWFCVWLIQRRSMRVWRILCLHVNNPACTRFSKCKLEH